MNVWDLMSSLLIEGDSSSWLPDTHSGQYGIQLTVYYRHWEGSDEGTSSLFLKVALVNDITYVSVVQHYNSTSVYTIVCSPPKV